MGKIVASYSRLLRNHFCVDASLKADQLSWTRRVCVLARESLTRPSIDVASM